jgi:hypothetical protein
VIVWERLALWYHKAACRGLIIVYSPSSIR